MKDKQPKIIGHVNGAEGHAQLDKMDLGSAIQRAEVKIANERWAAGFEEAKDKGPVQLLAYLLSGSTYDASNVEAFAASVLAAMTAAGFMVIKQKDLMGIVQDAIVEAKRASQPMAFDAEGTLLEDVDAPTEAEDPTH